MCFRGTGARLHVLEDSLLPGAHELVLLLGGLELTVTELGTGVDELDVDLLGERLVGLGPQGLAKRQGPLRGAGNATLDEQVILPDSTIPDEASHRSDGLVGKVGLAASVGLVHSNALSNLVDLLVGLNTVVVTVLTGTRDSVADSARVPGTNTSNLTQTLVGLARQLGDTPTSNDTFEAVTTGDTDGINNVALRENGINGDCALEQLQTKLDLLFNGTTVDLNLHDVSLLLAEAAQLGLTDGDHTDDARVLPHLVQILLVVLLSLLLCR